MSFVTKDFKNELYINVISKFFPNLNGSEKEFLIKNLVDIIEIISIKFRFNTSNFDKYREQFKINNYRDSVSLLFLMLPYINSSSNLENIKNLSDIYHEKENNKIDLNYHEPKYVYSNIQFGRCIREKYVKEIKFSFEHLEHNISLLKNTIQLISNKLFVNWIDIIPVTINDEYFKQIVDDTTKQHLSKNHAEWNYTDNKDEQKNYRGLPVNDIYNFLSSFVFDRIKNYKWLIYDIKINSKLYPCYLAIQKVLHLEDCIEFKKYDDLNESKKNNFNNSWYKFIKYVIKSKYELNRVSPENIQLIGKSLIFFFNKYYKKLNLAIEGGYKRFNISSKDDEEYDVKKITFSDLKKALQTVKPEFIYDFILENLKYLKNTIFCYKNNDKMINVRYFEIGDYINKIILSNGTEVVITFKNIYNYAKSITHIRDGDNYRYFGRVWNNLTDYDKNIFLSRLNDSDTTDWFNLRRYSKLIGIKGYNYFIRNLYQAIYENLPLIICKGLVKNGLLTVYEPQPNISSQPVNIIPKLIKKSFKKNKERYNKSYYFLTNRLYKNHTISTRENELNYFEYMSNYQTWYTTYAMNWISQIAFFHKYINKRVSMVTGSTGVGKSTQIPKLLLYALKAIDYKSNGTVICTQPRISPTEGNAERIADELGVPIKTYSHKYNTFIPAENFYVQFKHQKKSHLSNENLLVLKIVTDGSLLIDMNNPILKVREKNTKTNKYEYYDKNIYDIIIVDEAHEHNTNMDLILTLVKNSLYLNPSLRLTIISATMDDDEPNYRRFYRIINDNLLYPIDKNLEKFKLDRVNIDRRLHISPPKQSTRFNINEYFIENGNLIDTIMSIVSKGKFNEDILVFQPGQKEIYETIEELNKILPSNCLAVPYLSKMSQIKRNLIEKIDKMKSSLSRDMDFDYFMSDEIRKGSGISRVVIVATNIAEASITIQTLKYVVDTGTQKVGIFNFETGGMDIVLTPISESSRIQRKGRVGRVSSGSVYYMYKQDAMRDNKTMFNISTDDISFVIYNLLRNGDDDELIFETPTTTYLGLDSHYDYKNDTNPDSVYETGYDIKSLIDMFGNFYIIHPEEINIIRNLKGDISDLHYIFGNSSDLILENNKLISKKMIKFIELLQNVWLIKSFNYQKNQIVKTKYGKKLSLLREKLKIYDIRLLICYIFSRQYEIKNEMLIILSILISCQSTKSSPSKWFLGDRIDGKYVNFFEKTYKNQSCGDLVNLFNYITKVIEIGKHEIDEEEKNNLMELKQRYLNNEEINFETYIMFRNLDIKGLLTKQKKLTKSELKILNSSNSNYISNIDILETKVKLLNLNLDMIKTFIHTYKNLKHELLQTDNDEQYKWFDDYLSYFSNSDLDLNTSVNRSLLHGYSMIFKYIRKDIFVNIFDSSLSSLVKFKKTSRYSKINDTFTSLDTSYILGFMKNIETEELYLVQNILLEDIFKTNPIPYLPSKMKQIQSKFDNINYDNLSDLPEIYKLYYELRLAVDDINTDFDKNTSNHFLEKLGINEGNILITKQQQQNIKFAELPYFLKD